MNQEGIPGEQGLDTLGLSNLKTVYWNLQPSALIEQIILRGEGSLTKEGAVVVSTGKHTGRSPGDKFVVIHDEQEREEIWCGKINQPYSVELYNRMFARMGAYLQNRDVFVQDMLVGAHPNHSIPIRIITEYAWHSLFSYDLFRRIPPQSVASQTPQYTVIVCPNLLADVEQDGTKSGTFILVNFVDRTILIGGTSYAGEIKKSVFTVMNYEMPHADVLSMHCSANVGAKGDVALFFGLSGTGKTTLSSDPDRRLIGDDEHGWTNDGVFNFEGGCYAKTIRLRSDLEPIIWQATQRFGSVLENVVYDETLRTLDFDSEALTENTRGAYPLDYVLNHVPEGYAGHPETIFFLTADAFGVLPPIARLTPEQAMYYFLSGYTSKLAGTEKGLGKEPQATFSTCFGAPFLPLHPNVYAEMLGERIRKHNVQVWLINTGWTGGPYGDGDRIKLPYTRAMVRSALRKELDSVSFHQEEHFGLWIPTMCPGVPAEILNPINTWKDQNAYRQHSQALINRFIDNFKMFEDQVPPQVVQAGPATALAQ